MKSLSLGIVPTDWKLAEVTAVYKKGSKSDRGNYRPVSLTSVCCKILEQLIRDDLMAYTTPPELKKNLQVCHSTVNLKVKLRQTAQHMANTAKVKHAQRNNPNAEKISINRNEYSCMQFSRSTAKITRYSAKHEQQLNKRKPKQKHVIY